MQAVLTAISLFGNVLNCRKVRFCFVLWIFCNIGWLYVDITNAAYSRAILDGVQIAFSVYGFIEWGKDNGQNARTVCCGDEQVPRSNSKVKK